MKPLPCFEEFIFQPKKITLLDNQLRGIPVSSNVMLQNIEDDFTPTGETIPLPAGEYEIIEWDAAHVWLEAGKRYWVQRHSLDMLRKQP